METTKITALLSACEAYLVEQSVDNLGALIDATALDYMTVRQISSADEYNDAAEMCDAFVLAMTLEANQIQVKERERMIPDPIREPDGAEDELWILVHGVQKGREISARYCQIQFHTAKYSPLKRSLEWIPQPYTPVFGKGGCEIDLNRYNEKLLPRCVHPDDIETIRQAYETNREPGYTIDITDRVGRSTEKLIG